ncbi:MAG TPA: hypothetical protein PLV68_20185, partial [Ilumatobacteraceae bacterium]|nr:hypothetical protein [Ilumatobacteraceae bacterium]
VDPPKALGQIDLPIDLLGDRAKYLAEATQRLERATLTGKPRRALVAVSDDGAPHPVEDDPDLKHRLRAAAQAERIAREIDDI